MSLCKGCNNKNYNIPIKCTKCLKIQCENCLDKESTDIMEHLNDCRDIVVDKASELRIYQDIQNNGFKNMNQDDIEEVLNLIDYNKDIIGDMKHIMFQYVQILKPQMHYKKFNYEFNNIFDYYVCFDCRQNSIM